jgi:hypothetical protein
MKIFKIDVPIFRLSVVCCHSCSVEEAENEFYDFHNLRSIVSLNHDKSATGCTTISEGDIYLWIKSPRDQFSDVFHELVHVIDYLCELKGMEKDEELRAYLMGWFKGAIGDAIAAHLDEAELPAGDE